MSKNWQRNGSHMLNIGKSPNIKYREIPNFPPGGHLGLEIQNVDMCINEAYKAMFMHGYV